jgi:catechol 2,3-dioxygenase-like lactoylglutathione lyase family enzyme
MIASLAHVTLFVKDYDEAIAFYTQKLGLELRSDEQYGPGSRWVTVGIKGQDDIAIVLHIPHSDNTEGRAKLLGCQPGMVFATTDCRSEVTRLQEAGVEITAGPDEMPWGVQATFKDLYGNGHVLVQDPSHG